MGKRRRKHPYDGPQTTWQDDKSSKTWRPYEVWEIPATTLKDDRAFEWHWSTMKHWGLS